MDDTTLWFFGSYIVGNIVGLAFGYNTGARKGVETTVDQLVKNGFLRHTIYINHIYKPFPSSLVDRKIPKAKQFT